jgi:hypothetical protein
MNRVNLIKVLSLVTAMTAAGCFADSSGDNTGNSSDELRHAKIVGVGDGQQQNGAGGGKIPTLVDPNATETTFVIGGGPSPDPWHGDQQDGNPNGPSPDPWHPRAHLTAAPSSDSNGNGGTK